MSMNEANHSGMVKAGGTEEAEDIALDEGAYLP
jgi:hypothetical protein